MERAILTQDRTPLSSSKRSVLPQKNLLRRAEPRSSLPEAEISGFPVKKGGDAQRTDLNTGGLMPSGQGPPKSSITKWYTQPTNPSTRASMDEGVSR